MQVETAGKILVLSPHTDDGELACGGSMARFCREGREVWYACFSGIDLSKNPDGSDPVLLHEMHAAMAKLGVAPNHIREYAFTPRRYNEQRQDILQVLVDLNRELSPDLVLMPNSRDLHQDHATVAMEGMRAFKRTTVLCYEEPWNSISFDTEAFIRLTEADVDAKVAALECYNSQKYRSYLKSGFIRGWANTRGVQVGVEYAECFEVPRLIV